MSDVNPEALACEKLREYLLRYLPSRVTTVNAARAAVLRAPKAGPYVVQVGDELSVRSASGAAAVVLPDGVAVSASDIATAINAAPVPGITASADTEGRLVLTATAAPSGTTTSVAAVTESSSTDCNAIFGWPSGGFAVRRSPLAAPNANGVMDGWPVTVPDMSQSFVVVLGDRDTQPLGGFRRDMYTVTVELAVWAVEPTSQGHRSRDFIQSAVRCVREVLESDDGRTLGRGSSGDIQHVSIGRVRVRGMPFQVFDESKRLIGPAADVASMQVQMKVFRRPDTTP